MADQIIIEGDVVRHVRTSIVSETLLTQLAPHLTTRLATTLPVLPQHATRYISFDPEAGRGTIIVETTPRKHTMQVRFRSDSAYPDDAGRRGRDGMSRFEVLLPYQYFAYGFRVGLNGSDAYTNFTIDKSFLFWARDPIRTEADPLWIAACPNVDTSGSICWGSTTSDASSLSARLDDLVNNFFTTIFNEDLGHNSPFTNSMVEWERHSDGPLAYREWPYWDNARQYPLAGIAAHMRDAAPTNIAELNPSYIALPTLPENFSIARAREWIDSLSDGARRRLLTATGTYLDDLVETAPAEDELEMEEAEA